MSKEPVDPHYRLPAGRRVLWEHGFDVRAVNSILSVLVVLLTLAVILLGAGYVGLSRRPPYLLEEDSGYVMWRTTEAFRLRTDFIKAYLRVVMGQLFNVQPGVYDLSGLEHWCDAELLKKFSAIMAQDAENRLHNNKRQLWTLFEVRRYIDPKFPKYLCLAVRGEKSFSQIKRTDLGEVSTPFDSTTVLHLVYLQQVVPTPDNPWGLKLFGIDEKEDAAAAEQVWSASIELAGTLDSFGQAIEGGRASPQTEGKR